MLLCFFGLLYTLFVFFPIFLVLASFVPFSHLFWYLFATTMSLVKVRGRGRFFTLHCIAFARGHRESAENLYRYSRSFPLTLDPRNPYFDYEHQPSIRVQPPAQRFDAPASTRLIVNGHPSKYWPRMSLLDLGDRQPRIRRCRFTFFVITQVAQRHLKGIF